MRGSLDTRDKIRGLIFGQAIGDALGLATEFMSKEEVQSNYPDGVNHYGQIVQDRHRSRWQRGAWTDDTDQFLCVLRSILRQGEIDLLDIAREFKEWKDGTPLGIGKTTDQVLSLPQYDLYPQRGAELVWKLKKKDLAPNGGLMRNAAVVLATYWDLDTVLHNCEEVCKLTHFDPRCTDSCKVHGFLLSSELNGHSPSQKELEQFISNLDIRIRDYIQFPIKDDIAALQVDDAKTIGYTLKALSVALWAFYHANDFESGVRTIIEEGGDADTNGAIAGSLLGTKFGYSAIPTDLVDGLNHMQELENISTLLASCDRADKSLFSQV